MKKEEKLKKNVAVRVEEKKKKEVKGEEKIEGDSKEKDNVKFSVRKSRGGFKTFVFFVIFVAILNAIAHFVVYSYSVLGLTGEDVSGFVVRGYAVGDFIQRFYPLSESISRIVVISEWVLVVILVLLSYFRDKGKVNRKFGELRSVYEKSKIRNGTELDRLYEMLKREKKIDFGSISKLFDVDDEVVKSWAETLEGGKMASIGYPRIGSPFLVIREEA